MNNVVSSQPQSDNSFLELGTSGKSAWWRYAIGLVVICVGYLILGTILYLGTLFACCGGQMPDVDQTTGFIKNAEPMVQYFALNSTFLAIILFCFLVVRFLHSRAFKTLITPAKKLSLQRVGFGFALWFCLASIVAIIGSITFPGDYKFALQSPEFFYFAPLVLLITPMQCFAEELLFRGYLLQFMGKITKSRWWLCGINGFIFLLPHLTNPEMGGDVVPVMSVYFGIGFLLTLATIRSNSLEIAIGAHIGNNIFDALIVNYSVSALETRSIFLCTKMHAWYEFFMLVILGIVFYVCVDRYVRSKTNVAAAL
jgi:uncharacterized protein